MHCHFLCLKNFRGKRSNQLQILNANYYYLGDNLMQFKKLLSLLLVMGLATAQISIAHETTTKKNKIREKIEYYSVKALAMCVATLGCTVLAIYFFAKFCKVENKAKKNQEKLATLNQPSQT